MQLSWNQKVSSIFFCIERISIKFGILWKKDEPETLFVFEIAEWKKRGYLNA